MQNEKIFFELNFLIFRNFIQKIRKIIHYQQRLKIIHQVRFYLILNHRHPLPWYLQEGFISSLINSIYYLDIYTW
jgi:hypothetical protein